MSDAAKIENPASFSWADDAETPTTEKTQDQAAPASAPAQEAAPAATEAKPAEDASVEQSQTDGASEWQMGSALSEPEFDVNVKLNDLQADPDSPSFSVKNFSDSNLPEALNKGLASLNFHKPSKIQERALPLLLKNPAENLIGQSQSGTGKTAAFTLNILARTDTSVNKPQAIAIAPTRESARQILGVVQIMGQFMDGLKTYCAVPDPSQRNKQVDAHVVVGTPGTVMDLIRRRQSDASGVKVLVSDEADNMLDLQGSGDQSKRVKKLSPPHVQTVLFSATFPERVLAFCSVFAPNANTITSEQNKLTVEGIKQMYSDVSSDQDKYDSLLKFYGLMTIASSIIFVKRRDTASQLEKRMTAEGHHVASLTGALEGSERDSVIDRFREGSAKVLITTNVLARGIDVQSVTMVINYDIPETADRKADPETFSHRVGRTGRFGKVGVALTSVHDRTSWQQFQEICQYLNIQPTKSDTDDWDNVERVVKQIIKSSRNANKGMEA